MTQYNPFFFVGIPWLPTDNPKPPTLYAIMNSMANFGVEDKTKIKDLSLATHSRIFNFEYPLTNKISKEQFETMILNKFIMRRIGFDTLTAFQMQLNVKLNEIMPLYNKMFDALDGWNIFEDGEKTTTVGTDNRTTENNTTNNLTNNSTTQNTETSDRRNSELPQSEIQNVKDASYLTDYNLDTNINNGTDSSQSNGSSNSNTTDNNIYNSTVTRTPADKIAIYKEFKENLTNIYTLIFKDLEILFYGLV